MRIFPLANVALFPGIEIPLHVFEPRYRELTKAALGDDGRIGMVAVRPGHVDAMSGDPPLFEIGCAGVIRAVQTLPDGRYNIALNGTQRFRIVGEPPRPSEQRFRTVEAILLEEPVAPREQTASLRIRVERLLRAFTDDPPGDETGSDRRGVLADADDVRFANAICQYAELPVSEKQALLEANGVGPRLERLLEILQFHIAELQSAPLGGSETVH
ncbi:MAG: LON peptidase substrate-binding domain-containing protein [Deltaproteobacteria bacterium]|nr:MAG: LON peptidase substrate-binding domain-containing protein [Deltaproteobacteria bacterium]